MKKCLIVIDMQNDFLSGSLKNPDAQAIEKGIAKLVKDFDGDVIATRDTHRENYLSTTEGKYLPVEHCIEGTWGWQIADGIAAELTKRGAMLINKPTFGFADWDIPGYDEITLVGTCTDICVVSNALILKAKYPDTQLKIIASLCAGVTKQKHECALETMRSCQIQVL